MTTTNKSLVAAHTNTLRENVLSVGENLYSIINGKTVYEVKNGKVRKLNLG